jgi:decaprenylphospho-beta-D-ribofuranose 2-oxidase
MGRELISGWGGTPVSSCTVVRRRSADRPGLAELVRTLPPRGAIARGLGRSYGDSAQNAGGLAIRLDDDLAAPGSGRCPEDPAIAVDAAAETATAAGGVSLDAVLRTSIPEGLFVPVSPGTRYVTVGGAIAADIHGKNHHVDGTFGAHVRALTLLLADGTTVELGPGRDPRLFWATVGGMGLTGVIVGATFAMVPIETSRMSVDTERAGDLDELLALMTTGDDRYRYSVAWIDLLARGRTLGRSVLTRGEHARVEELSPRQAVRPLAYATGQLAGVPPVVPQRGLLTHASIAAFNEVWFRRAPRRRIGEIVSIPRFFHPLDAVGRWNRLYGRRGLVQYQFLVPFGAEEALRRVIDRLSGAGTPSFLAVLKRFGAANPAQLSFPAPGWTLALDLPAGVDGLGDLLAGLDEVVLAAGGRHYLAKDGVATPDAIRRGYPRLAEWQGIRDAVDPHGRWASDQSRRLRLTGGRA